MLLIFLSLICANKNVYICVCVCLYSRFLIVAWFAQICVITVLVQSFAWVWVEGDLVVKVCMCDRERDGRDAGEHSNSSLGISHQECSFSPRAVQA